MNELLQLVVVQVLVYVDVDIVVADHLRLHVLRMHHILPLRETGYRLGTFLCQNALSVLTFYPRRYGSSLRLLELLIYTSLQRTRFRLQSSNYTDSLAPKSSKEICSCFVQLYCL